MASPRRSRLPATVIALGVVSLFSDIGSEMVFPLLPTFLTSELGAGTTFLGLVEGAADSVASLLKLVSGYVADRLPQRKPLVVFGYGVPALVRPLLAATTAPWQVLAIRVTDRVGKGTRSSPRDALIADAAPAEQSGRAFGFHQAMDHVGAVCGPLVATALMALGFHLRAIFLWATIPGILAFFVVLSLREQPRDVGRSTRPKPTDSTLRLPASLKSLLAIVLVFSIGNSSDAFLLLRASSLGVSPKAIPLLWSVFHVSKVLSSYLGGWASDHLPRAWLITAGWIVFAGSYLGLGVATNAVEVWGLFLIYGLYYGLTEPTQKALVRDLVSPEIRGRAFGYYNFIVGASALPAGLLTGAIWKVSGPRVALGLGAALAGVSAVALVGWELRRRSASAA